MTDNNRNEGFHPGSILAVVWSGGRRNAQLWRSKKPYMEFARKDLDRHIGRPLLTKWGGRYVVGGRKILTGKPGFLVEAHLISGFLDLSPTRCAGVLPIRATSAARAETR